MEEQELFEGYEIRNWEFGPRFYKILAASAVFNVLALLVVAQSNLLTQKGCDSPLVGKVCQVIDTVVVGSNIMATNTEMVDKDYERTELENADIIWVDRTGEEKFAYPEGYFALSNPESLTPQEIPTDGTQPFPEIPGMASVTSPNPTTSNPIGSGSTYTPPASNDLLTRKPRLPKQNKRAVTGEEPDSLFKFEDDPKETVAKNPTPSPTPKKDPKNDPGKNPNPTADASTEPEINRKVMKDFAAEVRAQFEKKEVDLAQNFKVHAVGVLTKDGKLDVTPDKQTKQPKSGVVAFEGDPKMVEVAKRAIAAVGDSGWLTYLKTQGIDKFNFIVSQDNDNLQVIITSDLPNAERAGTVSSGLGGIISGALLADRTGLKKLGDDEKFLLTNMKTMVNPEKKDQFVLNFVLPKPVAQELITRKLKEAAEDAAKPKSNGSTAVIKPGGNSSSK